MWTIGGGETVGGAWNSREDGMESGSCTVEASAGSTVCTAGALASTIVRWSGTFGTIVVRIADERIGSGTCRCNGMLGACSCRKRRSFTPSLRTRCASAVVPVPARSTEELLWTGNGIGRISASGTVRAADSTSRCTSAEPPNDLDISGDIAAIRVGTADAPIEKTGVLITAGTCIGASGMVTGCESRRLSFLGWDAGSTI
ncbi:hypothetical protein [Rhodococcus rhodochrous]|uniref:hypothetical protein n=1 Tax=Rhodococcus rhodochrous TaxID=1829 RepID=UPI0032DF4E91